MDSPVMADFAAQLDPINAIADAPRVRLAPPGRAGNATAIRTSNDDLMVNMSVWESADALWDFVYASDHLAVMRRGGNGSST